MTEMDFKSGRPPVRGKGGMVAASQPAAVEAGLSVLRQGGNAVDAAVATAAALNVTEPTSTGLGGDCFVLYYLSSEKKVYALNGSGRAPSALTLNKIINEGLGGGIPPYHPYTITVPGACAGWCDLIERFGSLPLSTILNPAIQLAKDGFPVQPITAYFWQRAASGALGKALNGHELLIENRAPNAGETFRNPGLARTLELIAKNGKDEYYRGEIADAIVHIIAEAGGCLSKNDLAAHLSTWDDPISTEYKGIRVWECPPNGQGLVALIALNILDEYEGKLIKSGVDRLHGEIEAIRLAFVDGRKYITDMAVNHIPLLELLSKGYAKERASLIKKRKAISNIFAGDFHSGQDTVYFCVVDSKGNACSFINSNYMGFGTGIVPRGYGFSLQNRGHNFSLEKGHANQLVPGKRPYHTIIPGMMTDAASGDLFGAFGVMGGFMQPQGHVQVLRAMVDEGLDPQAALEKPRFCVEADKDNASVLVEEGVPLDVIEELRAMGHPMQQVSGMARAVFGRGQIILKDEKNRNLIGGSDPRADGCAKSI